MAESGSRETFGFQAEVKQLLHLMVHSLYSNREIFLRELISNASDASDKLRFHALSDPGLLEEDADLGIGVEIDAEHRRLGVTDNGIGMSREEIIAQLGTIAHSGTGEFLSRLGKDQKQDAQLIGQFGVGFYSVFMVADQVEVVSRRAGQPAETGVRWVSDGQGEYTLESVDVPSRGTRITLTLKEDASEFLDAYRIRALIKKYSDHIAFPVRLHEGADPASDTEPEPVNKASALWTRPRGQIDDAEYVEFYKHIAHDPDEPLAWSHNRVEGKREYTSLLYLPSRAPLDLWNRESPRGLKLYVRRVFIADHATQFLPLYLRFVRGVVDSSDLPLNVSRELLQEDPNVLAIRSALTKRVLDMLERLVRDEPEKYREFWSEFGAVLKEGVAEDAANRDKIAALLRFHTSAASGSAELRSLDQYLEGTDEQDAIYFLTADSLAVAAASPHLEIFRARGIEVLLLTDRIDEWVMQYLPVYRGKPFRDVTRGEAPLKAKSAEQPLAEEATKDQKHLLKRVKRVLRDRVSEVRASSRLTESPACLALKEEDVGHQLRELLKAAGHSAPDSVPALELNMTHSLVQRLQREDDESRFERLSLLLLDQAKLAEGRQPDDPAQFVKRLNALLADLEAL